MNCYNCGSKKLECDVEKDSYICLDCGYSHQKQYFFISHSHKDIEKVRVVRNVIEETFFYEPILFFLKCLSDETEINDLIKREIYERIWFVYCKSVNAEKSKYVQFERNYIQKLQNEGKYIRILEIDIDKYHIWEDECQQYIRDQIAYKIRKTNVFLSYSHKNFSQAILLHNALKEKGFSSFIDCETSPGMLWLDQIQAQIKKNSFKDGAILSVVSVDAINSKSFVMEARESVQNGAFIIPVIYDATGANFEFLTQKAKELYGLDRNFFYITEYDIKEKIEELCNYLLNY